MNYKILFIILLFLFSCETNTVNKKKVKSVVPVEVFSNKGFALLFTDDLKKKKIVNKKIDDRSLIIFQKNLKKNTKVKITSLINNKSVLATGKTTHGFINKSGKPKRPPRLLISKIKSLLNNET